LLLQKADLIAARAAGPAIVIGRRHRGSPSKNHIFGKPRSSDDARHMLEKAFPAAHTRRRHRLWPSSAIPDAERLTFVESTLVHFATLSAEENLSLSFQPANHMTKQALYGIQGPAPAATFRASKAAISTSSACPSARLQQALTTLGWSED